MIISAELGHVAFIAKLLVKEYKILNETYWHDYYKTDLDLFARIVESRIREMNGEFKYFVCLNENSQPIGFISLLQRKRGEVLMISFEGESKRGDLLDLLGFSIDYLKKNGSESIVFEASPSEEEYRSVLNELWARNFSSKFIM